MRGSDNLVINLSPLPSYQNVCCADQSHGLQGEDNPGTLNTLFRDVEVFMGRTDLLRWSRIKNVVISPMDVVGPAAFLHSHICKDNVHPSTEFLTSLTCAILLIRRES